MSQILLRREHDLTPAAAREKVERVADVLAKRFDAECEWQGDVLTIKHPTVSGTVTLGKNEIVVAAKLGLHALDVPRAHRRGARACPRPGVSQGECLVA